MPVLIGMRCLQAIGSSAVISVGAGSLADMYEVHERGQKVGFSPSLSSHLCFLLSIILHDLLIIPPSLPVAGKIADIISSDSSMGCLSLVQL
jgi:MFS family permease